MGRAGHFPSAGARGAGAQAEKSPWRGREEQRRWVAACPDANVRLFHGSYFSVVPTIQELKSSGVMLGGNGLIRCEGAGVPAPIFEWYRGERK